MPCQAIKGNLDEFAETYKDRMEFLYLDADLFGESLFTEHAIEYLPSFKVFKEGKVVGTESGTKPERIKLFIESNLWFHINTFINLFNENEPQNDSVS